MHAGILVWVFRKPRWDMPGRSCSRVAETTPTKNVRRISCGVCSGGPCCYSARLVWVAERDPGTLDERQRLSPNRRHRLRLWGAHQ